jgi:hypothetical protein
LGSQTGDGETPYSRDGLIAQWNFNETSGTVAYNTAGSDSCGGTPSSCNGTLTTFASTSSQDQAAGTGWTANNRRWGAGGLMFDGSNDYLASINTGQSIKSVSFWINTNSTTDGIIELVNNTNYISIASGAITTTGFTSPTIYVNGSSLSTKLNPGWNFVTITTETGITASSLIIGEANFDYFSGVLDSVAIYTRTLSAVEVLANSQVGNLEFQTRTGATATPNDGTWEAWRTTSGTGDTQIDAMDATTGWAWDGNTSDPTSVALDTTTKIEGTGSLKALLGVPEVDASTVGLWHMDETSGSGAYIKDATANANNGTPTGTTLMDGFYAKTRSFNGSSDYISVGALTGGTAVQSVDFWAYPTSTTTEFIDLDAGTHYINATTGTVAATGFTSPTIYVNGVVSSTIVANQWQHIAVTTGTSFNASNTVIGKRSTSYLSGKIDEVKISNTARTADEIAEGYRAGRDHRISKSVSSVDLSAKSKVPFYIASNRPGTFLEATIGESAYANYEPDANTVGLWHLEEAAGSGAYIKDSSGVGNNLTPTGTTFAQGKIGKARNFNGSSDYIRIPDNSNLNFSTGDFYMDFWEKSSTSNTTVMEPLALYGTSTNEIRLSFNNTIGGPNYGIVAGVNGTWQTFGANGAYTDATWKHIAISRSSGVVSIYINGQSLGSSSISAGVNLTGGTARTIGSLHNAASNFWNGLIDEVRILNTSHTPDEIRQAYEIGKRTHTITNDFVTNPQAAYSSGTSVTINNPYGTTNLTDTLALGDTMIFKENVNGTETVSQAVVTAITNTSSVYGTVTLLAAPTFPSGGFTTAAKVFKWQREWFDVTSSLASQRDAINRITLRVTDGSQGANIWIDDIKSAGPYLSNATTRNSTVASTPQKFVQYRVIFSTTDTLVSPNVTSVALTYNTQPKKVVGSDTLTAAGSLDRDGNVHLGSNNVKKVAFYDRTKDQISYALDFDNSNDYVAVGTGPTSVKTVEFWVNPNSTSTEFIDLNGSAYINVSAGTISATGFTSPTIYVNGSASTTLSANQWSHIAVTTGTGLNATALNFGKRSTSYFNGQMDEVALYSSALTATQVADDYNARRLSNSISNLVSLYHFDEGAGTRAYDSTGGFHGTLTNMAATAWVNSQNDRDQSALSVQTLGVDPNWVNGVGRRNNAQLGDGTGDYYSTSSDFLSTGGSAVAAFTVEAWVNIASLLNGATIVKQEVANRTGDFVLYINGSGQLNLYRWTGTGTNITIATSTLTIATGYWYHVAAIRKSDGNFTYCINGICENISSSSTTANFTDGRSIGDNDNPINGIIDEFRISDSARYTTNFTPSRRFTEDGNTKALYHFDEGADNLCSGGTNDICDSSSNGYDLAVNGNPTWVTDARAIQDNNARYISLGSSSSSPLNKGMEIYAISTTQFKYRWVGDQVWSSAVNFSSYVFATPTQLGTTGVYVGFDTTNGVFGDESYFLIPSWVIESFSSTRGIRRSFPERSYLIATDRGMDIIDADDNTLWMRTSNGVTNNLLGTQTLNVPSSVSMSNGQLAISTNGTSGTGVYRLDFNRDTAYRYNVTNRTTGNNNLAKRNMTDWSWGSADTGQNLIDSIVNDVSLLTSNGRLVMATANNTGLTKIANIMSNDTSYDYSDVTSNAYNRVKLGENYVSGTGAVGDMYALNSTNNALERWNNVVADVANETNGTPDATVNATSTPALFASAQTVNDLDVKPGVVYVGHNSGTTVFTENRATLASSSVKYYTKDYIGEEMVGDIRGMYPIYETSGSAVDDISIQNLDGIATGTTIVSGIRGKARVFTASNSDKIIFTRRTMSSGLTFNAWVKTTSTDSTAGFIGNAALNVIGDHTTNIYLGFGVNGGKVRYINHDGATWAALDGNTTINDGIWHMISVTHNSSSGTITLYVDGKADGTGTRTYFTTGMGYDTIGAGYLDTAGYQDFFDGTLDEIITTANILTTTQISQLYTSGLEALNNKYRVKLASDTVNQLAGTINVVKGVAASDNYIFAGTNTTGADDGILSRVLLRGDVTDRSYDESTTDPVIVDNDINSVAVSKDGAYIVVGTDDQGITIIQNGSAANRLRAGSKVQGPYKRPHN